MTQARNTATILAVLLATTTICNAANILALFTIVSPSHRIWCNTLLEALAGRGHNVTALTTQTHERRVPNLTYLVTEGILEHIMGLYSFEERSEDSVYDTLSLVFGYSAAACKYTTNGAAFRQLMNYPPDTTFDLVIIESIASECLLGLVPKFGYPPIVVLNALMVPSFMLDFLGSPNMPSYMPFFLTTYTNHMSFSERVKNFLVTARTYYHYHYSYLPAMDEIAALTFGSQLPPSFDVLKNVSLGLSNFHPSLDYAWPFTPNLISVGGMHVQEPKHLPTNLKAFLDGAKEGAVLFSLGSNVRSDRLTEEKRAAILGALRELPQRVLWKFESDIQGLPPNVMVGKWLPQNDVLAHPNVKLFITHSGLLSTQEAIYREVPVIGIPFLADQHGNIRRLVNHGCGLKLEYNELTEETLLQAVNEVLGNSSYRENMRALSRRFRDDPQPPLQRAVHWTEVVLRHRGAPHLRSAARELSAAQLFLLDVAALLLAAPAAAAAAAAYCCCRRRSPAHAKLKRR